MNLYDRIKFRNHSNIPRLIKILDNEMRLAVDQKNIDYIDEIIDTAQRFYDQESQGSIWAKRLKKFIEHSTQEKKNL